MELIAAAAYKIQWHLLSPRNRFGVWLLIAGNQRGRPVKGFGPIKATLDTFLAVINEYSISSKRNIYFNHYIFSICAYIGS